jgi:hypothetical protein
MACPESRSIQCNAVVLNMDILALSLGRTPPVLHEQAT